MVSKNKPPYWVVALLILLLLLSIEIWLPAAIILVVVGCIIKLITRSQDKNENHTNRYQPPDGSEPKETITVEAQELDSDL